MVTLLAGLAALFGAFAFVVLAWAVHAGMTQHVDDSLLLAARDPADPERLVGPR